MLTRILEASWWYVIPLCVVGIALCWWDLWLRAQEKALREKNERDRVREMTNPTPIEVVEAVNYTGETL